MRKEMAKEINMEHARLGHGFPSLSAQLEGLKMTPNDLLPKGEYCLAEDFLSSFKQAMRMLKSINPHRSGRSFVVVKATSALTLLLELVCVRDTDDDLPGLANAGEQIKADHRKMEFCQEVANDIKEEIMTGGICTVEDLDAKLKDKGDADLILRLLAASRPQGPKIFNSRRELDFQRETGAVDSLPSGRKHILEISVGGGVDQRAGAAMVNIQKVVSSNLRYFQPNMQLRMLCPDKTIMKLLLVSQLASRAVQVEVSLVDVPIDPQSKVDPKVSIISAKTMQSSFKELLTQAMAQLSFEMGIVSSNGSVD